MSFEEEVIAGKIEILEHEKSDALHEFNLKIQSANKDLELIRHQVNIGLRRLLTDQGDILVDEVGEAFKKLGFEVEKIDDSINEGAQKKEDLRIRIIGDTVLWEAIVEVRGYSKSGFQTSDIQKIGRFAGFYLKEKGKYPDKRIYVVNGQIDLQPPFRDKPFASAKTDLETFSEDDGLVIWTVELFQILKKVNESNKEAVRNSITNSTGYWSIKI